MAEFLVFVLIAVTGVLLFRLHRPFSYEDLGELPLVAQIHFAIFIIVGLGALLYVQSN